MKKRRISKQDNGPDATKVGIMRQAPAAAFKDGMNAEPELTQEIDGKIYFWRHGEWVDWEGRRPGMALLQ